MAKATRKSVKKERPVVMAKATRKSVKKERPVVLTTEHRGVFFGYATDTSGDTIKLKRARNAVYWPAIQKGFVGLAAYGPAEGSRIGPAADMELRDITAVLECTPMAVAKWEAAPWN